MYGRGSFLFLHGMLLYVGICFQVRKRDQWNLKPWTCCILPVRAWQADAAFRVYWELGLSGTFRSSSMHGPWLRLNLSGSAYLLVLNARYWRFVFALTPWRATCWWARNCCQNVTEQEWTCIQPCCSTQISWGNFQPDLPRVTKWSWSSELMCG